MAENKQDTSRELSDTEKMVQEALAEAQSSLDDMQQQAEDVSTGAAAASSTPNSTGISAGASAKASGASGVSEGGRAGIELLSDVDLQVSIELGRTQMLVEDVLRLGPGSVVELDKLAGDPVDVYVNQRLVARGEVLVLNDNFCIRISEIVADLEEAAESNIEKNETF